MHIILKSRTQETSTWKSPSGGQVYGSVRGGLLSRIRLTALMLNYSAGATASILSSRLNFIRIPLISCGNFSAARLCNGGSARGAVLVSMSNIRISDLRNSG
jgi:hypothetical protein